MKTAVKITTLSGHVEVTKLKSCLVRSSVEERLVRFPYISTEVHFVWLSQFKRHQRVCSGLEARHFAVPDALHVKAKKKNAADSKHHCPVCYLITEEKKRNRRTRDTKLSVALALGVKFNVLRDTDGSKSNFQRTRMPTKH